jgi:hypothetical protein
VNEMRGRSELAVACRTAASAAREQSAHTSAFAVGGCRIADAARFAQAKAVLLRFGPDSSEEYAGMWYAVLNRQAERACLDGCLVGLCLAGTTTQLMPSAALDAAGRQLSAQMEQRSSQGDPVREMLRLLSLDPNAVEEASGRAAAVFTAPLNEFGLTSQQRQLCSEMLSSMWLTALAAATLARQEDGAATGHESKQA